MCYVIIYHTISPHITTRRTIKKSEMEGNNENVINSGRPEVENEKSREKNFDQLKQKIKCISNLNRHEKKLSLS